MKPVGPDARRLRPARAGWARVLRRLHQPDDPGPQPVTIHRIGVEIAEDDPVGARRQRTRRKVGYRPAYTKLEILAIDTASEG